jgi:hypothetical protein
MTDNQDLSLEREIDQFKKNIAGQQYERPQSSQRNFFKPQENLLE